jgi:DNA-directed RNA polymerase alpha subunit
VDKSKEQTMTDDHYYMRLSAIEVRLEEALTLVRSLKNDRQIKMAEREVDTTDIGTITEGVLDEGIDEVNFMGNATRIYNCLHNANVVTVRDLVLLTRYELLRIPNIGRKSLHHVEATLKERGLRLGMFKNGQ